MDKKLTRAEILQGFICCLPFWYLVGAWYVQPMLEYLLR